MDFKSKVTVKESGEHLKHLKDKSIATMYSFFYRWPRRIFPALQILVSMATAPTRTAPTNAPVIPASKAPNAKQKSTNVPKHHVITEPVSINWVNTHAHVLRVLPGQAAKRTSMNALMSHAIMGLV